VPQETVLRGKKLEALPAIVARQHALVTIAQLRAVGLSDSAVSKRVTRGVLHREYRGVYSLARPLSRKAQLLAPVLASGRGSFLGHYASAEVHELLRRPAHRVDILAPGPRALPVHVHTYRRLHPLDVTERDGTPVTSVARTLVDLTALADVGELTNVIHEAAFRGSFSALAARDAMARAHGRRNLHKLQAALTAHEHGSAGTKSGNERTLQRLIKAARLPEPLSNVHVEGIEADLFWPEHRLCLEVDGHAHGRSPTRREDELKDRLLNALGHTVLRVPQDELERSPEAAIARIARVLAQ
jgi:very-short-patch-repair endonuclease/predicted transcriptional regulator of viral defense system